MNTQGTLESIINAVADPIFVKDRQHRWVLLNDACCRFIGHTREELIGKSDYDFFPKAEADVFREKDEAVFHSGRENLNEESFTDSQGVKHTILTKKTLFTDTDKNAFIVGVIRDVTDLKQAHELLVRQAADLARSETEREHLEFFTYVAAHDLREPLQRIVGFSDLLISNTRENVSEESRLYLKKVQDGAYRMSELIDDLLNFSKVVKRAELFHPVDLSVAAAAAVGELDFLINQSRAQVQIAALPVVRGDESQLRQLFQNLISNAIKFKKDNDTPRVKIESRPTDGAFCEIIVADEGIGLDPKYSEKIFKPFERLHTRQQYPGSGIGLAICQKIMSYHGGIISVQANPGQGAIFVLSFPKP